MSGETCRIDAPRAFGAEYRRGRQSGVEDLSLPSHLPEVFHRTARMNLMPDPLRCASWAHDGQAAIRRCSRRGSSNKNIKASEISLQEEHPAISHIDRIERTN